MSVVDEQSLFEPSTNIKRDLNRVVTKELFNTGIFSGAKTYDDAPNPCLRVEGYGSFGLPLSDREARDMELFALASGGEGGLTFPGEKVYIDNPSFDTYVKSTIGPALNALVFGPKVKRFDVDYRLRSLTIRGPDSVSSLWSHETISKNSQYGTLSILLPSRHAGGRIHTTHQGITRTFETASDSAARVTALAWYTGVGHNLESIESGHIVCLCYELTGDPLLLEVEDLPRVPRLDKASARLGHIFRSWRHNLCVTRRRRAAPHFLVCLLDYTYPDGPHTIPALKPSDKLKLEQLERWTDEYGFDLHFASVEYSEWWRRRENDPGYEWFSFHGYESYYESEYASEDDHESFHSDSSDEDSGPEIRLSFKSVRTLEGIPMQIAGRAIDSLHEKDDPTSCFINDNADGDSCLFSEDSWDGVTAHIYKFSTIVISPRKAKAVSFVFEDTKFALEKLSILSKSPSSPKDEKILAVLLHWLKNADCATAVTLREVIGFLRNCADRWRDIHVFRNTVRCCGMEFCINLMGADGLVRSYQTFGWGELNSLYTRILSSTPSRELRVQLVEDLLATAKADNDTTVTSWCQVQREHMLNTAPAFEIVDIDWILNLVGEKQNPDVFLYSVVIPRLQAIQIFDVFFWDAFLSRLAKQPRHLPRIQACLADMADRMAPWTMPLRPYSYDSTGKTADQQVVDATMLFLGLGIRFRCFDRCMCLLQRMWDTFQPQAKVYYPLLVPEVDGLLQIPEGNECLEVFFTRAASLLVPSSATSLEEFRIFQIALIRSGRWAVRSLDKLLTPEQIADIAKNPGAMKWLINLVSHTLPRLAKSEEATKILDNVKQRCLVAHIDAFPPRSLMPQYNLRKVSGNPGLELLELCFDVDLPKAAGRALERFLVAPPANDPAYIKHGLLPLLKELPDFLYAHHSSLRRSPFSTFAAEIVTKFVRYVLPPKPRHTIPSAELKPTGCGRCSWCTKCLVPFMLNTEQCLGVTTCSVHHVEDRLKPTKKWDFTWKRNDIHGGLTIYKPPEMVANAKWLKDQKKGRDVLRLLGDEEHQRQILASDYQWVVDTIEGTGRPPPVPLTSSTRPNGVGTKRLSESMSTQQSKKSRLL